MMTKTRRTKVRGGTVRVRSTYALMSEAVSSGITWGLNSAFKHVVNPDREVIAHAVEEAVMGEICGAFTFDEVTD
jgi:hypothetical protein